MYPLLQSRYPGLESDLTSSWETSYPAEAEVGPMPPPTPVLRRLAPHLPGPSPTPPTAGVLDSDQAVLSVECHLTPRQNPSGEVALEAEAQSKVAGGGRVLAEGRGLPFTLHLSKRF